MSDESEDVRDAIELAAAQLVACVKRLQVQETELPIVDQSSVWTVAVKQMGIRQETEKSEETEK